jgi:hypothetical protein
MACWFFHEKLTIDFRVEITKHIDMQRYLMCDFF